MIKTPLSTVIGGAFWTPSATIIGGTSKTFNQLIKSLFANNEQGFFYDPNDLSTMFQDAAGTVPVTAAGQPVGLIKDKSGNNNHAYQTTSASRPILRQNASTGAYYLEFDGSDDFLVTNSIDFTSTDKVAAITADNALGSTGCVLETGTNRSSIDGTFGIFRGSRLQFGVRGTLYRLIDMEAVAIPEVLVTKADIKNANLSVSQNGESFATLNQSLGIGNFGNYPLYIGRRAGTSLPFNGHIYGLIGIGRLTTDSETAAIEKELAKRTGVTLSV